MCVMKVGVVARSAWKVQTCAQTGLKTRFGTNPSIIVLLRNSFKTTATASHLIRMTCSGDGLTLLTVPLTNVWTVQPLPDIARGVVKSAYKMLLIPKHKH